MVDLPQDDNYLREIAQIMRNPSVPHVDATTGERLLLAPLSYCAICSAPISSAYVYCYKCNAAQASFGEEFPDIVVPLTYAGATAQSSRDVYKYKDEQPSEGGVRRLSILLYFFVSRHSKCLEHAVGAPLDSVVAVPSSKGRQNHPLKNFLQYFPPRMLTLDARFVGVPRIKRGNSIRPEDFELTRRVDGEHVLVLEDTLVQGGNAISLAVAAKRFGAVNVTVLPLARMLDSTYALTSQWLDSSVSENPFDPDFCPVSRGDCPR